MTTHHPIASANFSKKTLRTLAKRGMFVIDTSFAPGADGSYAAWDAEKLYVVADNGTAKMKRFMEVLALAV